MNSHVNERGGEGIPSRKKLLSIVVPARNEERGLVEFQKRLSAVLDALPQLETEIVYVNDGSRDGTLEVMRGLKVKDLRIAIVNLSRSFGKDIAISAGLDHACGDAVVIIDSDLQHPPELIPELINYWMEGYDVVYATRASRDDETFVKKTVSRLFYRLVQRICRVKIPEDVSDFRLLSSRAVETLKRLREQHRFMKGLFSWIGYRQKAVPYHVAPRFAGRSKWNYWRMWNYALEGITSFSTAPLKIASYIGSVVALVAFLYAGMIVFDTLIYGNPVAGYPTLVVLILFLGGVQLVFLGVIGEYLGRMFDESKQRPLYVLEEFSPAGVPDAVGSRNPRDPAVSSKSRSDESGGGR
jgi:glycosyltransferase involved in cell wall biosynthesis